MSRDLIKDIELMHEKYKVNYIVSKFDNDKLQQYLKFRTSLLTEEYNEFIDAKNADDAIDALIDIVVVAIGTLDAFDIDANKSWDRVLSANMNKVVGIKPNRPNPLGLPDLMKPDGWEPPTHADNVGLFNKIWK